MTIRRTSHGTIKSTPDEFHPHGLDLEQLDLTPASAPFYSISDLTFMSRISDRISRVRHNDNSSWILKIARFAHEIPALQREVSLYSFLTSSAFPLSPRFMGYVYEETRLRTVWFLIEDVSGTVPDVRHLGDCVTTVRLLHSYGVIHGDLNRYNFLVTEDGVKVFDFEFSTMHDHLDAAVAREEIESLEVKLRDETGVGRR